jgi:hypothetical protein
VRRGVIDNKWEEKKKALKEAMIVMEREMIEEQL